MLKSVLVIWIGLALASFSVLFAQQVQSCAAFSCLSSAVQEQQQGTLCFAPLSTSSTQTGAKKNLKTFAVQNCSCNMSAADARERLRSGTLAQESAFPELHCDTQPQAPLTQNNRPKIVNDVCQSNQECVSGSCDKYKCAGRNLNESCSVLLSDYCDPEFYCDNGTCVAALQEDQKCQSDQQCAHGLYCDGVCKQYWTESTNARVSGLNYFCKSSYSDRSQKCWQANEINDQPPVLTACQTQQDCAKQFQCDCAFNAKSQRYCQLLPSKEIVNMFVKRAKNLLKFEQNCPLDLKQSQECPFIKKPLEDLELFVLTYQTYHLYALGDQCVQKAFESDLQLAQYVKIPESLIQQDSDQNTVAEDMLLSNESQVQNSSYYYLFGVSILIACALAVVYLLRRRGLLGGNFSNSQLAEDEIAVVDSIARRQNSPDAGVRSIGIAHKRLTLENNNNSGPPSSKQVEDHSIVHEGAIVNHLFEQNASAEGDYMVAGSVKYGDTGTDTSFDDAGSGNLDSQGSDMTGSAVFQLENERAASKQGNVKLQEQQQKNASASSPQKKKRQPTQRKSLTKKNTGGSGSGRSSSSLSNPPDSGEREAHTTGEEQQHVLSDEKIE